MAFFQTSSSVLTGFEQKVAQLNLFLHQNFRNQTVPVSPGNGNDFGTIAINDWVVRDGPDASSKVVARAQGHHFGAGQNKPQWYTSFNMLFEDERFKGSSLVVRGVWDVNAPIEWAIVGGTGQFPFAQGIIYGNKISQDTNARVMELNIHILYRPLQRPAASS